MELDRVIGKDGPQAFMSHALDGCRAKLKRAHELIRYLDAEAQAFMDAGAYTLSAKSNPQGHLFVATGNPVSDRLRVLIGEVVHHSRSALDHLVWQLVIANGRQPGPHNEFPIFHSVPSRRRPNDVTALERRVEGVSPAAIAVIESLQPYHRAVPEQDPLWLLHKLNIINNHRLLIASIADASVTPAGVQAQEDAQALSEPFTGEVEIQQHGTVQIVLPDAGGGELQPSVPDLLWRLTNHVEQHLIVRLEAEFF
jgi:hypothetical protein